MALNWGATAFFLVVLALVVFYLVGRIQAGIGIPRGRVIYCDTADWEKPLEPLISARLGLVGRPDYLVNDGVDVIPVEVKSHSAPHSPYPSHVMQLAAYCALVTEVYGRRPAYGILRYADRTFEIPYTDLLEARLMNTLAALRADRIAGEARRDHQDARRCGACAYRKECPEALFRDRGAAGDAGS